MQLTLLGIIWIPILLLSSLFSNVKGLLFVTLFSMVLQCDNVMYLGETAIGVQIFTVSFAILRLLLNRFDKIKRKSTSLFIATLILLIIAIFLSCFVNQAWEINNLLGILMIVVYALLAILITQKRINIDFNWLERVEDFIIIFVLIVGFLQVLSKSGFSSFDNMLTALIYNDTQNTDVIFHHKPTAAFYSTFMEPSYCGAFLVASFTSVVLRSKTSLKNVMLCAVLMFVILMTRSSTAFGGLAIMICLTLFVNAKKRLYKALIPIIAVTAVIVWFFNMDLLNEVIFDKIGSTGSYTTRSNWNKYALEAFHKSPYFGIGFKNIRASSIYLSLLGEIGLVGIIPYTLLLLFCAVRLLSKRESIQVKSKLLFVFSIVVCQIIACPDLNFSPFWLGIYLLMLTWRCEKMVESHGG